MNIDILSRKKRKEIHQYLKDNFDITLDFPHYFIQTAKEKIRLFTGEISETELSILKHIVRIENLGLYFSFFKDQEYRFNFDFATAFGNLAKKNILELNEEQTLLWMQGKNLDLNKETDSNIIFIKYNDNILGVGKISNGRIWNFVPKERRTNFIN